LPFTIRYSLSVLFATENPSIISISKSFGAQVYVWALNQIPRSKLTGYLAHGHPPRGDAYPKGTWHVPPWLIAYMRKDARLLLVIVAVLGAVFLAVLRIILAVAVLRIILGTVRAVLLGIPLAVLRSSVLRVVLGAILRIVFLGV
jgi:hypothetical protein